MNIDTAFPSAYLNASALNGAEPTVAIDRVEVHTFDPEGEKPVIFFVGKESGLVLNKTRAMVLRELFGSETDKWKGQKVTLGTAPCNVNGKMMETVTINRPTSDQKAKAEKPAKQFNEEDDVPF